MRAGVIEPVQIHIRQMIVLVVEAPGRTLRKSGTDGSNPVPSSGGSDEVRIRPPPNINKASSNRSGRRGYGVQGQAAPEVWNAVLGA
jgi:hypothetical protein